MDQIQALFYTYGYLAVFIFLYCGLIGIPAAEESFMIFIGITLQVSDPGQPVSLPICIVMAALGSTAGMMTAYLIGYYIGEPFIVRFGKYIGLTAERWKKAQKRFQKHSFLAIIAGYFIPGIRQINPYLAGMSRTRFVTFATASLIGSSVWSALFILLGYFMGGQIHRFLDFGLPHVILIGVVLFIGFVVTTVIQIRKKP